MIYTITFSPALDYIVDLEELKVGEINRTKKEAMLAGGKGINVSIVLANLGRSSVALGFTGGFVGAFIEDSLTKKQIQTSFVHLDGNSRINVKVRGNVETAINAQGPSITEDNIEALMKKLESITCEDILVISGAIPSTLPANTYERILSRTQKNNPILIVDTTKDTLRNTLKYHPLLVKPNLEELEELFDTKTSTIEDIVTLATNLCKEGAQNVIVSLGKDGAILLTKEGKHIHLPAPSGKVVNTVGAGDSMVAGFIDAYVRYQDVEKAFPYSVATGSASAFSFDLATKEEVELLYKKILNN